MNTKAKTATRLTAAKGALLGGALVVTGFAAAADLNGASAQAAKSLDVGFTPLVDTQAFGNQSVFIAGAEHKLVIRDQNAWLVSGAQERPAADGFYRLSNNRILKIAAGKVFQQSVLAMATCCWKDWLRKVQSRTPGADADVQSVYVSLFS